VDETHGSCIPDRGCIGGSPYALDRFVLAAKPDRYSPIRSGHADKDGRCNEADKTNTIAMINKGEGGFLQGDIYPFCFQTSDGKVVATAPSFRKFIGTDIRTLKDPAGKVFGPDLFEAAKEGKVTEVGGYQFPKPGTGCRGMGGGDRLACREV
jgi:hypothetical protein